MDLDEGLKEMNNNLKRAEIILSKTYLMPFKFEHFEWKQVNTGVWRIFYKKQPLLGSPLSRRMEASNKIEGLLIVATKLRDRLIKKLTKANDSLSNIGNRA